MLGLTAPRLSRSGLATYFRESSKLLECLRRAASRPPPHRCKRNDTERHPSECAWASPSRRPTRATRIFPRSAAFTHRAASGTPRAPSGPRASARALLDERFASGEFEGFANRLFERRDERVGVLYGRRRARRRKCERIDARDG